MTRRHGLWFITLIVFLPASSYAQSTAFTYQGKLSDNGNPASGTYDFQFRLFDLVSGGVQQGTTQTISSVTVTNGIFSINLDCGVCPNCFDGNPRFLDIW